MNESSDRAGSASSAPVEHPSPIVEDARGRLTLAGAPDVPVTQDRLGNGAALALLVLAWGIFAWGVR